MSDLIFHIINTILFALGFCVFFITNNRDHAREIKLEQEKALRIGFDEGANSVLDMSVDDYVMRQAIRRETNSSRRTS